MSSSRQPRQSLCAIVLAALAFIVVPEVARADAKPRPVKVMTRNLYLGADLTPAIAATNVLELALAGTQIWNTVVATDFPERAKVLAYEIADADPDLIGLQEAAIWRTGPPDGPPVLGGTPATTVQYDYLQSLLDELEAIGTPYVVVYSQEEADIESITTLGFDARLTQRDAILAKKSKVDAGELTCTDAESLSNQYPPDIQLRLPLLGGLVFVESTRGYVAADCIVNKRAFRFVNTHLEAFSSLARFAQAQFLAAFGPANTMEQPVVLVGDINSDRRDGPPNAINLLINNFGFIDTWAQVNGAADGFTSGFNEFVDDPDASGLSRRIDHVMTRPQVTVRKSRVTGIDGDNRTPAGLWPSDHAGVVTTLTP